MAPPIHTQSRLPPRVSTPVSFDFPTPRLAACEAKAFGSIGSKHCQREHSALGFAPSALTARVAVHSHSAHFSCSFQTCVRRRSSWSYLHPASFRGPATAASSGRSRASARRIFGKPACRRAVVVEIHETISLLSQEVRNSGDGPHAPLRRCSSTAGNRTTSPLGARIGGPS